MNIPNFLRQQYVDPKTGYLTDPVHFFQEQLTSQLQYSFSDSGLVVPSLNTQQISNVTSPTNQNSKPDGTIFYNSETGEPQIKVNGTVKTLVTI